MATRAKVLGLAGKAGAGKDFVYDVLGRYFAAQRIAFADGVRLEVEAAHPDLDVWTKPYDEETREILQWWGTDYRRKQDPNYWVHKGVQRINAAARFYELVVVTDIRFANEAAAIEELGGMVAEVYAHDEVRRERLGGELPPEHASEVIDFPTSAVIVNNEWPHFPPAVNEFLGLGEYFQPLRKGDE